MKQVITFQVDPNQFKEEILKGVKELIEQKLESPVIDNENYTAKETASFFNVSLVTIHSWTKRGILKKYKVGNRVFYKKVEILEAIQEIEGK